MKNTIKDYLYYNKAERSGIILLVLLCLLMLLFPLLYPRLAKPASNDFSQFHQDLTVFREQLKENTSIAPASVTNTKSASSSISFFAFDPNISSKDSLLALGLPGNVVYNILRYREKGGHFFTKTDLKKIYGLDAKQYQQLEPFIQIATSKKNTFPQKTPKAVPPPVVEIKLASFNPNLAESPQLLQLGLSEKVVNTILNYRNKGGTFRKKEDLKKIFGISEIQYQSLEPYIILDDKEAMVKTTKPVYVDINLASPQEWQQIKGIGPAFSKWITSYREKLGGFSSIEQIGETYGFPDSIFQKIKPQLQVSPITRPLKINTIKQEALQIHPYLNPRQAKVIINYRRMHGPFQQWEDFEKIKALDTELLSKIKPYILIE